MGQVTNVTTYQAIALDAYKHMHESIDAGRIPLGDKRASLALSLDPDRTSFKQAMITIVFTGIWLEAILHLLIVLEHGREKFKDFDRKPYEDKIRLLGCSDQKILDSAERFRKCRKELVHEKALLDVGEIKTAEDEAENAYQLLKAVDSFFLA